MPLVSYRCFKRLFLFFRLCYVSLRYVTLTEREVVSDAVFFQQNAGGRRSSGVLIVPSDENAFTSGISEIHEEKNKTKLHHT